MYGNPRSRMYAQQSSSVQSASGFAFHSSCCVVPAELRRVGARRRLVAADAGDPAVEVEERAVERLDLRLREVEVGVPLPEPVLDRLAGEHLDRRVVARLDRLPELVRLGEEVVRVDREDARLRVGREEHVEEDRLLLLERARERDAARELLERVRDDALGRPRLDVRRKLERLLAKEHLLHRVAAQAEPERLERDDLVGRDVAEVDATGRSS